MANEWEHDISTPGKHPKVIRIVRPGNHVGPAYGGDRLRLDASELASPAVAAALWTDKEAKAAERAREQAIRARLSDEVPPMQRRVDAQLAEAQRQREARAKAERMTAGA